MGTKRRAGGVGAPNDWIADALSRAAAGSGTPGPAGTAFAAPRYAAPARRLHHCTVVQPSEATSTVAGSGSTRRAPEKTLLYRLVAQNLDGFVAHNAARGGTLPWFVRREFDSFLRCGILAHGFCRLYCVDCRRDRLVAFSCKGRSLCPSCGVRRMADGAAHLVDRVLPRAPVRQWVLSLPYARSFAVGFDVKLCGQVLTLFIRAVGRCYRRRAKAHLGLASVRQAHTGAVTAIQRFSGSLGLNVHFHSLFVDGVFLEQANGTAQFRALPPPSRSELQAVTAEVCAAVQRLRGLDPDDLQSNACRDRVAAEPLLAACAGAAVMGHIATGPRAGARVQRLGGARPARTSRPGTRRPWAR